MEITTMTGKTLEEVLQAMTQVLPAMAYSEFRGQAGNLTDISPAFLTEVLTEVFGPVGFGWFYKMPYGADVELVERPKSGGGTYETWEAQIDVFHFHYRLWFDGEERVSDPVISNGGSDNNKRHFALRGAITQAIAGAAKPLCWQLLVYKDILNHNNAADMRARYLRSINGEPEEKGEEQQPSIGKVPRSPIKADVETGEIKESVALSEDVANWLAGKPSYADLANEASRVFGYVNPGKVFTALHDALGSNWKKKDATALWMVLAAKGMSVDGNGGESVNTSPKKAAVAKGGAVGGQVPHPWPPSFWRKLFASEVEHSKLTGKQATNAQKRDVAIAFQKFGGDANRHEFQMFVAGKESLTEFTSAEGDALKKMVAAAVQANTFEDELMNCLAAHYEEITLKA